MKILITGGAGFIGSHAAKVLHERGDEVLILDNFSRILYPAKLKHARIKDFLESKVEVVEGDINDVNLLESIFKKFHFDAVMHLAAHANPRVSLKEALAYTRVNVDGTVAVLEAAAKYAVKQVVFAGSSSVYNDAQTPFREDAYPLRPKSPYGASKAAAEDYCAMWHDLYGIPITVLRFFSVYGQWGRPDMAPMIFAEKVLTGEELSMNREERKRDVTHISDVVRALVKAVDTNLGFEVLNTGRGEPVSLRELVAAIEQAAGKEARIAEVDSPAGEMKVTYADTNKAKQLLGWEPVVSLKEGAEDLGAWMRDWYLPTLR